MCSRDLEMSTGTHLITFFHPNVERLVKHENWLFLRYIKNDRTHGDIKLRSRLVAKTTAQLDIASLPLDKD